MDTDTSLCECLCVSRREFLRTGLLGAGLVVCPGLLGQGLLLAGSKEKTSDQSDGSSSRRPFF